MCLTSDDHTHHHEIELNLDLMVKTNEQAELNRAAFDAMSITAFNLMSSPGSGKTTLLEKTISLLSPQLSIGVIEGDMTTELDAERLRAHGVPVIAITTGRSCHLDAGMVGSGLDTLPLADLDLIFVENVGNLICPAEFPLGTHFNVVLLSVTEGADKILKYPVMFYEADCVVITKVDLCPYVEVDPAQLIQDVLKMRPNIPVFTVSARTGAGLDIWLAWINSQCKSKSKTVVEQQEAVH